MVSNMYTCKQMPPHQAPQWRLSSAVPFYSSAMITKERNNPSNNHYRCRKAGTKGNGVDTQQAEVTNPLKQSQAANDTVADYLAITVSWKCLNGAKLNKLNVVTYDAAGWELRQYESPKESWLLKQAIWRLRSSPGFGPVRNEEHIFSNTCPFQKKSQKLPFSLMSSSHFFLVSWKQDGS